MLAITSATSSNDAVQASCLFSDSTTVQLSNACALLALMVHSQATTQAGAKTTVEVDAQKMEALKKQLADAIQQAKDAANSSGFFGFLSNVFGGDIAAIAGAVVAAAAVIATGGAAAPLLLVMASEALQLASKYGKELGFSPELCMALGVAAMAVGLLNGAGAGQVAGALADYARDAKLVGQLVQASATATGGACGFVSGAYHAKDLNLQADALGYQAENDTTSMDLDDALALLERALRAEQRETSTVSAITKDEADASVALCRRI